MMGSAVAVGSLLCDERGKGYVVLETDHTVLREGLVRVRKEGRGDETYLRLAFALLIDGGPQSKEARAALHRRACEELRGERAEALNARRRRLRRNYKE